MMSTSWEECALETQRWAIASISNFSPSMGTAAAWTVGGPRVRRGLLACRRLKYLEGIGLERIEAQSLSLVDRLRQGLVARGFRILTPEGTRSSLVSFYGGRIAKGSSVLYAHLGGQPALNAYAGASEVRAFDDDDGLR